MAIDRIVSLVLRAAELVFAAIVAGVNGEYLHKSDGASAWQLGRFIYTEVVAALGILFSLLLLIPFSGTFIHWPLDIFMSINWWIVFGLLVDVSHTPSPSLHHLNIMITNLLLQVDWRLLRSRVQLGQRSSYSRRSVRQVQGHHRLQLPLGTSLARLCPRWLLLGSPP